MRVLCVLALLVGCGPSETKTDPDDPDDPTGTDPSDPTDPEDTDDTDGSTVEQTEAGDSIEDADLVVFNTTDFLENPVARDAIDEPGDRDFFAVHLEEGDFVLFATAAYADDGDTTPDTVLRLYDEAGTLLAENDDMPLRFWETDSALYFSPQTSGVYYIEVLEWSDWAPESAGPMGGSTYTYSLLGLAFPFGDIEYNDEPAAADALYDDGKTPLMFSSYFTDTISEFYSSMSTPGDVDLWVFEFSDRWNYTFNFWPTTYGILEPELALYDEDMNLLAWTTAPQANTLESYVWYDFGLMYPVEPKRRYYLSVTSATDAAGPGTFYPGFHTGYTREDSIVVEEEEPNESTSDPMVLETLESKSTPGYFYGYYQGFLPEGDVDTTVITTSSGLNGKYLTVMVQAEGLGSLLDAHITLYGEDGTTVLAETSTNDSYGGADPHIVDLPIGSDGFVFVEITPEAAGTVAESNTYYVRVVAADDPVFGG